MKKTNFRIQVPAVVIFSVQAETPEEALAIAERVRVDNDDNGWDVDLNLDGEELDDADGRAYLDSNKRKVVLTEDDIQDVIEPNVEEEKEPT